MGVTLTSRPLGKAGRAPMCGVPHHAWQAYVGKLLRVGLNVVICDQLLAAVSSKRKSSQIEGKLFGAVPENAPVLTFVNVRKPKPWPSS